MKRITLLCLLVLSFFGTQKAFSQDAYLGEIRMFAGNYAPAGWATCDGQLLPIAQNTALFSLLGTMYGGDGQTTFALPDLRGRVPVHSGTGPGLSNYQQGQAGGSEANTITVSQMPAHNHTILAVTADGNQNVATNNLPANTKALDKEYSSANPDTTMNPGMVGNTGGNQPVNNIQPYLAVTYIIALQGIYPPHN
ncbi:phage tail protein [Flavobacterium sp. GT3R68]|uniref:phage tail protein n=1 Tax=Flavobacterium sp. GT3R68 TaxID=2594437 RepID=UPI002106976D|nr:tail fiber protein [Flavobacterium sp. GT3R68]